MTENEFVFASYITSKKNQISQEQVRVDLKYHFGNGKYVNECASLLESKGLIDRNTWQATDDLHLVYQSELRKRLDKEYRKKCRQSSYSMK